MDLVELGTAKEPLPVVPPLCQAKRSSDGEDLLFWVTQRYVEPEMRRGKSYEPGQMFYVGLLAVKRSALALFLPPVAPAVEGGLRKVSDG